MYTYRTTEEERMDCVKIGKLIASLRKEHGLTQKALAEKIYVSDKAVSKWERGIGCPDVSLLPRLSEILGTALNELLEGELSPNKKDIGNLRRINFYVCPYCGNIVNSTSPCSITCCGRTLKALTPKTPDEKHQLTVEEIDDSLYVSNRHPMSKDHYLGFIALVTESTFWLHRLYPEQDAATSYPKFFKGGTLFSYCSNHGLQIQRIVS